MAWGRIFKRNNKMYDLEPQEILLDALSQKKEEEMGRFEVPLSEIILKIVFAAIIFLFLVILGRVAQLQIFSGDKYRVLSENNQYMVKTVQAARGVIYDRNFKQLVRNISRFDLVCKSKDLPEETLRQIADILGKSFEDFKAGIRYKDNRYFFAKDLDQEAIVSLNSKISQLPNCELANNTIRDYYEGFIFANLLGYKRNENEGDGIEMYYDEILRPKEGKISIERDARGNLKESKISQLPESGRSIVLNIDGDLQKKIIEYIKPSMEASGAVTAAAVAMNPQTGEVLALVSLPGYDNNIFSKGVSQEEWNKLAKSKYSVFMNRAIAGQYPSGSTIKPFIGLAALENRIISENTVLDCPLNLCVDNIYSGTQECFVDWKYHGASSIKRAIAESVNPFFYQIAGGYKSFKGLGILRATDYLQQFGFGTTTSIDLRGEEEGILPTPDWKEAKFKQNWSLGDTYNLSIGQGYFQTTPIQMAVAVSAIANGGTVWKPKVIQKIVDENKNVLEEFQPEIARSGIIKDQVSLRVMQESMRYTVESQNGTAHLLSQLPVSAASKTGTAQISRKDRFDTWIAIYAPAENPQIVLVLLAEEVPNKRFFVLPVSYEVLKWYFGRAENKAGEATSSQPIEPLLQEEYIN